MFIVLLVNTFVKNNKIFLNKYYEIYRSGVFSLSIMSSLQQTEGYWKS